MILLAAAALAVALLVGFSYAYTAEHIFAQWVWLTKGDPWFDRVGFGVLVLIVVLAAPVVFFLELYDDNGMREVVRRKLL